MDPDFSNKTLVQVIPKLIGGGAERTTLEVAKAFTERGGRSLVVSSGGPMTEELEASGSEHRVMPVESKNPVLIAQNARDLAEMIREQSVSLIHARSRAPAWSCLSAARRTGIPYVTTYHGVYKARSSLKRVYNSVMVRSDAVIANSQFTADHIANEYAGKQYFHADRVIPIARGADLDRFHRDNIPGDKIEAARALFGPGFRILLPGRFTPWKGQATLIPALRLLQENMPGERFTAIMIGRMDEKPDYVESLQNHIDANGLTASIQLVPATDDMAPLLAAADVVVSASTEPEAFGRVAVEAQAAGTPVIATAHGGALETVSDGETGFLIPPGDPKALAGTLGKLAALGQEERRMMGTRGMARAVSKFSIEAMTRSTMIVYQELLMRWENTG